MKQTKWESAKEACSNTGMAFIISLLFHKAFVSKWQVWWVEDGGLLTDWWAAFWITCFYTILSLFRNYIIRRWFNKGDEMKHAELRANVLLHLPATVRMFNNSGGVSQHGKRFITHGLEKGSSDLIGWTQMGDSALFTAIELKREKEKCRPDQLRFLAAVARAGGIAAVVRSIDDLPQVFNAQRIATGEVYDRP